MAREIKENRFTFFKFCQDQSREIPIYIKVDLSGFGQQLVGFLLKNHFSQIGTERISKIQEDLQKKEHARILSISQAPSVVIDQIFRYAESDQYGHESIVPNKNYKIYRYRKLALMVYANNSKEWRLGAFPQFGSLEGENAYRIILARFLGLALAPLGIVGFWGSLVDDGMIIFNKKESAKGVVFLDVKKRQIITGGQILPISMNFKIIRLQNQLKGKKKTMTKEELFSFLSINCIYFDYGGKSLPIRQAMQGLAKSFKGYIYPGESFRDALDLSI